MNHNQCATQSPNVAFEDLRSEARSVDSIYDQLVDDGISAAREG